MSYRVERYLRTRMSYRVERYLRTIMPSCANVSARTMSVAIDMGSWNNPRSLFPNQKAYYPRSATLHHRHSCFRLR